MELKAVLPWGVLTGVYLSMVYIGGPISNDLANAAPGIFIVVSTILTVSQIRNYLKSKKQKVKQAI